VTRPDDLEPLDDELVDLFAAERRRPGPPPEVAARVRAAVLATVATGVAGSAAAAHGTVAAGNASVAGVAGAGAASAGAAGAVGGGLLGPGLIVVAALAATVGGTLFVASYEPEPTPAPTVAMGPVGTEPVAPPTTPTTPPPPLDVAPATPPVSVPPRPPRPAPPPPAPMTASAPSAPTTPEARAAALAEERSLLASARQALQASDVATALVRLAEHRARHPDGVLVEERDALTLMARARRGDDVTADLASFRARYPRSLFQEAVDRAVRER
jgi:hypothetical protein